MAHAHDYVMDAVKAFFHKVQTQERVLEDEGLDEEWLETRTTEHGDAAHAVPWTLQVAAAWAWRIVIVGAAVAGLLYIATHLTVIIIPLLVGMLLTVLLEPVMRLQMRWFHMPRTAAAAIALVIGIVVVFGLSGIASSQIVQNAPALVYQAQGGFEAVIRWLTNGPLQLDATVVNETWQQIQSQFSHFLDNNISELASRALSTASSIGSLLTGTLMCLFCVFFFLKDGRKIWHWGLRLLPVSARNPLNEAAIRGWVTLGSYARTQMLVAAIDAAGIGGGALILGVPLAIPLAVLVFFASFIPIVGAIATGILAVAIALVSNGFWNAVIMLVVILVVQQIESNVLQPFLMSNAVSLHPVAVLLAVAAGSYIAGIVGAVFAVPILAFVNTTILYLKGYDKFLRLKYDTDRPGGPPGSLEKEMAEAARPDENNIKEAQKAYEEARQRGTLMRRDEAQEEAGKAQAEVQEALAQFEDSAVKGGIPESVKPDPHNHEQAEKGVAKIRNAEDDNTKDD